MEALRTYVPKERRVEVELRERERADELQELLGQAREHEERVPRRDFAEPVDCICAVVAQVAQDVVDERDHAALEHAQSRWCVV